MKEFMQMFWQDESGQDLAEYAILLGVITVAVIATIILIGDNVLGIFERANTALDTAN